MIKLNLVNLNFFISIFIFNFLLAANLNYEDYWFDELFTFYVSDPNVSFYETYLRIIETENNNFYKFILKIFFLFFGYNDFNGRLFVAITGSLIPVIATKIYYEYISKSKFEIFLVSFFLIINYFLILQFSRIKSKFIFMFDIFNQY